MNIGEEIKKISENIENSDVLSTASNEELIGYLFLVEKMKTKLEKMIKNEK